MTAAQQGNEEDREAFRIDDSMELHYRLATAEEVENPNLEEDVDPSSKAGLLRAITSLEHESAELLAKITTKHQDIGDYLKIMDHKIRLVAEVVSENGEVEHEPQNVNLSETGLGFGTKNEYKNGTLLRLHMILRPTYHEIPTYVEVVKCFKPKDENESFPFFTAVKFVHMLNSDKHILARHIMRLQTELRRKSREEGDNS